MKLEIESVVKELEQENSDWKDYLLIVGFSDKKLWEYANNKMSENKERIEKLKKAIEIVSE